MNIKDLQPGSYKVVDQGSTTEPKLNINNLNAGSYKVVTGGENLPNKPFKYDVAEVPISQEQKIAQYKAEDQAYAQEAKKAKSFGGFMKNFGKAIVENLAPSETGLGETVGKSFSKKNLDVYNKNIENLSSDNATLTKLIKEREGRGEDVSSLKRAYNSNVDLIEQNKRNIEEYSKNLPSTTKVLGQIGGTALDVLTAGSYGKATQGMKTGNLFTKSSKLSKASTVAGIPELGKMAKEKATGIFTKNGATNIAKGAGIGYATDVTQGMQGNRGENREGASALIPGLGTVIGTAIPTISEGTQTIKNITSPEFKTNRLVQNREKELNKLDRLQTLKKATEKGRSRGIDIKKVLSETDVLSGSVDNTGTITTKGEGGAVEQYTKEFIDGNENIVSDLLKKEGRSVSPDLVKKKLKDAVMASNIQGQALKNALNKIDDEVQGYVLRSGNNGLIPIEVLHNAKIDKYNNINFFTEGNTKAYDKTIANALKKMVEENTTSADVAKINKELSKHFAVIDYLNKLDGKKVEGGKLGKYFAQTVGAVVGSHFGPLGAIAGAEAGGRIKGGLMSRAFGGKTGKISEQSEVIKEALRVKGEAPLQLGGSVIQSKSLGNLNIPQTTTANKTNTSIKNIIPQSEAKGNTMERITDPNKFERATDLSPENKALENRAFEHVINNEDQILKEYFAKHGKVINADNFRQFFKDQGYTSGSMSAGVQEPSSYLAKRARTIALQNPGDYVVGTAGGSGAGKTSAVKHLTEVKQIHDNASMILDSNFSKLSSALSFINEAKQAGKEFVGVYTYRDFIDAVENGVIKRMLTNPEEMGRVVPNKVTSANHIDSWNVIQKLVKDHNIPFIFIDNSLGAGKAKKVTMEELQKKINYSSKEKMLEEANQKVKDLYESKKPFIDENGDPHYITEEQYKALTS